MIEVRGFETTGYPDSFFDCVTGNMPFGDYRVAYPKHEHHPFLIHDHFIAKSLDLVRPGGIMAMVTSSGTMDKEDSSARRYFVVCADLLGAICLPEDAFRRDADTSVVADTLFLQKDGAVGSHQGMGAGDGRVLGHAAGADPMPDGGRERWRGRRPPEGAG